MFAGTHSGHAALEAAQLEVEELDTEVAPPDPDPHQ
jgi:hypothetical protein